MSVVIHREDVKALLRKRYGSLEKFAASRGIEVQAVRDLLRGRSRSAVEEVAAEIGVVPDQLVVAQSDVPFRGVHTKPHTRTHRLNAGAK